MLLILNRKPNYKICHVCTNVDNGIVRHTAIAFTNAAYSGPTRMPRYSAMRMRSRNTVPCPWRPASQLVGQGASPWGTRGLAAGLGGTAVLLQLFDPSLCVCVLS